MLYLVLAEAALELVPIQIIGHPSVKRNAKRQGKKPNETLLDRSLHHYAMQGLPLAEKRGRPDIAHICLLEALGSPLNKSGFLKVWLSTLSNRVIEVDPSTRLPRDYNRFKNLFEQLLIEGKVPPEKEQTLLLLRNIDIIELKKRINPTRTVALTSHGDLKRLEELCKELSDEERPMVIIGAYPSGEMEEKTLKIADNSISIYPETLEAWVVTSRFIYEYEKALGF